jgi:gas vesicle protein
MKNIKILLYTLSGLLVGAGLGLLLAPSSGSTSRERIMVAAEKFRKRFGLTNEEEFSDSEMEMDATTGRNYGF